MWRGGSFSAVGLCRAVHLQVDPELKLANDAAVVVSISNKPKCLMAAATGAKCSSVYNDLVYPVIFRNSINVDEPKLLIIVSPS